LPNSANVAYGFVNATIALPVIGSSLASGDDGAALNKLGRRNGGRDELQMAKYQCEVEVRLEVSVQEPAQLVRKLCRWSAC
jgi:hypothetical protein